MKKLFVLALSLFAMCGITIVEAEGLPEIKCDPNAGVIEAVYGPRKYHELSKSQIFQNRKKLKKQGGCHYGTIESDNCFMVVFKEKMRKFETGNPNKPFRMVPEQITTQCRLLSNPSKAYVPPAAHPLTFALKYDQIKAKCPAPDPSVPCTESGGGTPAYSDDLKKKKQQHQSMCMPNVATSNPGAGQKAFCEVLLRETKNRIATVVFDIKTLPGASGSSSPADSVTGGGDKNPVKDLKKKFGF
jgi:hypothetical protein